ncbi:MAG: hypothetical protein FP816_02880 [Desulfobacteraceae bacterium]|nr:hypothetical protein [Desulfobacteraceae bacterium]
MGKIYMDSLSKKNLNRDTGMRKCSNCRAALSGSAKICPECDSEYVHKISGKSRINLILCLGTALLLFVVLLFFAGPRVFDAIVHPVSNSTDPQQQEEDEIAKVITNIQEVSGQFYAGRAIDITGEGFGQYDMQASRVTVDGKEALITAWGDTAITVIVPGEITKGRKEITLENPPVFDKKSIEKGFLENIRTEVAKAKITPDNESVIKCGDFEIYISKGSVSVDQEVLVYKFETPSLDDNPYYTVTEEFEITGANGGHVFFNNPVLISMEVANEEEALNTTIQYFDDALGVWVMAETAYNLDDGKLYVKTNHFCGWRKFKDRFKKVVSDQIGSAMDAGKKIVSYPYKAGKFVVDKVVDLGIDTYINDAMNEKFIGVDDNEHVIVYYRESDAQKDPGLPEKAKEMAAAFSTAYEAYTELFGWKNMPNAPKFVGKGEGFLKTYLKGLTTYPGPKSITIDTKYGWVANPLKVYIDPNYNAKGANYSMVSGNISMPGDYPKGNMAATCAHELFHAVQHKQLGLKQLYIANGFKDVAKNLQSSDNEVHKHLANNKWFLEATAEYASLFIGTNTGILILHDGTYSSLPYYAFNGAHEYGMSAFLDYIVTHKNTSTANRGAEFKKMWDYVVKNYSMLSDINSARRVSR